MLSDGTTGFICVFFFNFLKATPSISFNLQRFPLENWIYWSQIRRIKCLTKTICEINCKQLKSKIFDLFRGIIIKMTLFIANNNKYGEYKVIWNHCCICTHLQNWTSARALQYLSYLQVLSLIGFEVALLANT